MATSCSNIDMGYSFFATIIVSMLVRGGENTARGPCDSWPVPEQLLARLRKAVTPEEVTLPGAERRAPLLHDGSFRPSKTTVL